MIWYHWKTCCPRIDRLLRIYGIFLLFAQIPVALAQAMVTEVIPLAYRSLHEMAPIVQPLVGPGGSVSGLRDRLVVTTTPARMREIRKVLAQLDTSPERLVISVRQATDTSASQGSATIHGQAGTVGVGGGGISVGTTTARHERNRDHVRIVASEQSQDETRDIVQRVQVVEGREAFISVGQDLPVRTRGVAHDTIDYYPARTGFFVVPRLKGDQVLLEISAQSHQTPTVHSSAYGRRSIDVSSVITTVAGRLGEWLPLGGVGANGSDSAIGIGRYTHQETGQNTMFEVKVEKIQE
jgi:hypothetical protein